MATAKETRGLERGKPIRFELESIYFQTDLADDSKGEKVEEIPEIISPLLIRPEKERNGRIWKGNGGGAKLGFRAAAAEGRRRLTGGPHLSASEGARAAADWAGWAEKREKAVLGRLSAQSQKKTF